MYRLRYQGNLRPSERQGLVRPVRVDPSGVRGPTKSQARTSAWRSPFRGWHVPAEVPLTVEQRILEAATLASTVDGAVTGWAALRWGGATWLDGSTSADPHGLPVDIAVARDLRRRPGIVVCEEGLAPTDCMIVDGIRLTREVRSVAYALRYAPDVRDAVRVLDMAAYSDLVSLAEVQEYVGTAPRLGLSAWTGVPQAREAVVLGNENAWSPQEVALQLVWVLDAGLPPPLLNQPVFDRSGRHLATPDLLDIEAGVVAEYNGAVHLNPAAYSRDNRRLERYRDVGLEPLTVVAGDLADTEDLTVRMHAARHRARWQKPADRPWTIQPPAWWVPTTTVEQRRALTPSQRLRFLGYRSAA